MKALSAEQERCCRIVGDVLSDLVVVEARYWAGAYPDGISSPLDTASCSHHEDGSIYFRFNTAFTQTLDDDELRACAAHEVGHAHARNRADAPGWEDLVARKTYLAEHDIVSDLAFHEKLLITFGVFASFMTTVGTVLWLADHALLLAGALAFLAMPIALGVTQIMLDYYARRHRADTYEEEYAADAVAAAYTHPETMVQVLQKTAIFLDDKRWRRQITSFFGGRLHPSQRSRIKRLRRLVDDDAGATDKQQD